VVNLVTAIILFGTIKNVSSSSFPFTISYRGKVRIKLQQIIQIQSCGQKGSAEKNNLCHAIYYPLRH